MLSEQTVYSGRDEVNEQESMHVATTSPRGIVIVLKPCSAGLQSLFEWREFEVWQVGQQFCIGCRLSVLSICLRRVHLRYCQSGAGCTEVRLTSKLPWNPVALTIDSATCLIETSSSAPVESIRGSISSYSCSSQTCGHDQSRPRTSCTTPY